MLIYQPKSFKVGFSTLDGTVKANLTPDEDTATLKSRIQTIKNRSNKKLGLKTITNDFMGGFSIYSISPQNTKGILIQDPRGFLFKQSPDYFERLIAQSIIQNGSFINRLVYLKIGKRITLVSEKDQEIISKILTQDEVEKSRKEKHIPGCTITTATGGKFVFLGMFYIFSLETVHSTVLAFKNKQKHIRLNPSQRQNFYQCVKDGTIMYTSQKIIHKSIDYGTIELPSERALETINSEEFIVIDKKGDPYTKFLGATANVHNMFEDYEEIPLKEAEKELKEGNAIVANTDGGNVRDKSFLIIPDSTGFTNYEIMSIPDHISFLRSNQNGLKSLRGRNTKYFKLYLSRIWTTTERIRVK